MPATRLLTRPAVAPGVWSEPPLYPPVDWFTDEAADAAPPKLTLYPDGRIAGVVAPANVCTLNELTPGECWTVPRPADGRGSSLWCPIDSGDLEEYRMAHVGSTFVTDGDGELAEIVTANLAGAGGHASQLASPRRTQVHYNAATDDTRYQVGRGRYVWSDSAGGVVFVGAAWPEIGERQAAEVRAAAVSIDYRPIRSVGALRLLGSCLVNIGALPSRFASLVEESPVVVTVDALGRFYSGEPAARAAALHALDFPAEEYDMRRASTFPAPAWPATVTTTSNTAAVEYGAAGRDARLEPCTDCGDTENRTAAYLRVTDPSPDFGRQVTWAGGAGMYVSGIALADGSPAYIVYPEVNGSLDDSTPVVVAQADASVTDQRYEYVPTDEAMDGAVITAGVRALELSSEAPPDLALAALDDRLAPIEAFLAEREAEGVSEALAGLDGAARLEVEAALASLEAPSYINP